MQLSHFSCRVQRSESGVVLVVDDDDDVRDFVTLCVKSHGHEAIEARDGQEALRTLHQRPDIDLLLTDVKMPGNLDGVLLGREAARFQPRLKVLHITGAPEIVEANADLVAQGRMLEKPFRPEQLLKHIDTLLGRWAADRNSVLKQVYDYWLAAAAGRPYPDRSEFDPSGLRGVLPYVGLIESIDDQPDARFRYRLLGQAIIDGLGGNPTGQVADDFLRGSYTDGVIGACKTVAEEHRPVYTANAYLGSDGAARLSTERVYLPLSVGGGSIRQILIAQSFQWLRQRISVTELERTGAI